jgi:hypothetical protein
LIFLQGYKFTVTANYPPKLSGQNRSNWLLKLGFEIERCLSIIAMELIQGPTWNEDLENAYTTWMENSLVKPEYFNYLIEVENEKERFLMDFIDRPPDSLAEKFIKMMKSEVQEDQGSVESVNKAVYATCAAILRVNNLTAEALALVNGVRNEPSPTLIKAWKAGQKMRNYFSLNDLKASITTETHRRSTRSKKPSLYAGADEEVIETASKSVISRAKFLLRVPIQDFTRSESESGRMMHINQSSRVYLPIENILSPAASSKMASTALSQEISPMKAAGGTPGGAANRWQLAAKASGNFRRQVSHETKNVAEMWHSLVSEATAVDKLKNVFLHRRKSTERSRQGKDLTPSEKVLQFVQSDVEVNKLHEMNSLRNKRAISRAKGFDIFSRLFKAHASPFGLSIASSSFMKALNKAKKRDVGTVHYANGLEGCSPEQLNMLCQKVSLCLKQFVEVMKVSCQNCFHTTGEKTTATSSSDTNALNELWQGALLNALKSFAMDYDPSDHLFLLDSGIVDCLEELFKLDIRADIQLAASALFHILVTRFNAVDPVLPESDGAPTDLSKRLIVALASLLQHSATPLTNHPSVKFDEKHSGESNKVLIQVPDILRFTSFGSSFSIKSETIPLEHSFSFAIKRNHSTVLDAEVKKSDLLGKPVMRGPAWDSKDIKRSDCGFGSVGIVTQVNEEAGKLKVRWGNNVAKENDYNFNFDWNKEDAEPTGEVVLADPVIAGFVFSKGSSELGTNFDQRNSLPWITHLSIQLLPDATLLVAYSMNNSEGSKLLKSNVPIKSDSYCHITITFDLAMKMRIFVNGAFDSSVLVFERPEMTEVIESEHPLDLKTAAEKKTFQYSKPINGWNNRFVLFFDEKTNIGNGNSFLVESQANNTHLNIDNLTRGNPALLVPSSPFQYSLVLPNGETAKNQWGYKMNVLLQDQARTTEKEAITTRLPFYFGTPPNFMNNTLGTTLKSFEGSLGSFFLYRTAFDESEIKQLSSCFESLHESTKFNEQIVLNLFSILKKSADNSDSLHNTSFRRCIANSGLLSIIFQFFQCGTSTVRCSAYRLAALLFPVMEIELVESLARKWGFLSPSEASYSESLLVSIGKFYNITSKRFNKEIDKEKPQLKIKADDQIAINEAQVLLFKSFAKENSLWCHQIRDLLKKTVQIARENIEKLRENAKLEMSAASSSPSAALKTNENDLLLVDPVLSLLSLFGGCSITFALGSTCIHHDPVSDMKETVTVLGPTFIPVLSEKASEEEKKKWSNMKNYGDAIAVVSINAHKNNNGSDECIMIVPRSTLTPLTKESEIDARFFKFIAKHFEELELKAFYHALLSLDIVDQRDQPMVLESSIVEEAVFESVHPYDNDSDEFKEISFDGAFKLEISFDERSRTETNCDIVEFFKDAKKTDIYGVKYSGRVRE